MAACVSLAVCASCSDEEVMKGYGESDKLSFGVSISEKWNTPAGTRSAAGEMPEWSASKFDNSDMWLIATSEEGMDSTLFDKPEKAQTRAAEVTSDSFYEDFGVYAYVYEGTEWAKSGNVKPYFTTEKVTKGGNDLWTTDPTRYWPGEQYRMHFFAYAPYDMADLSVNDNIPVLSYTVPDKVTEQKDLVVATADVQGNYNQSVSLQFKHILTAVKVKVAQGITGVVKKVALRNINNSGSYTFGGDSWTLDTDNKKNFVIEYNAPLELDGQNSTFIADGANTFMMIPQVLGEEATLEVELDNGEKLTGSLYKKVDWGMGYTVIYNISRTEILYEFSATDPDTYAGEGGSKDMTIKSYMTTNGVQTTPLSWTNDGYYSKNNDGTYTELALSDWVVFPTPDQTEETMNYSVKVYPQSGEGDGDTGENSEKTTTSPDKELQKMQEVSSESSPKNLAGTDGGETTANSYIVNGPGWYKFPIVYGNALKNGNANEKAYNYADHIVNHLGNQITNPWITNNNITINGAELLWQDSPASAPFVDVNSVKVEGNYIKFRIPAGQNCVQGNAVIAVKDDKGNIAWSWHIWVTLHKPDDTFQFGKYSFFHTLLGYREAELVKYPVREVYVKLVQEESQEVQYVHISQAHLYQFVAAGNAPYYQHGRKDPFPGASLKVTRDNTGKYSMGVLQDKLVDFTAKAVEKSYTLGHAIQNPNIYIGQADENVNWYWYKDMNYGTYEDNDTGHNDLWDYNGVKTVYDPCPAGYKIPSVAAIEFVANTDKNNVEFVNTGMYFINNKDTENEQRFFLQILGSRRYEGKRNGEMSPNLIACIPSVQSNGSTDLKYLNFDPNQRDIYWTAGGTICMGQCVLPQKE